MSSQTKRTARGFRRRLLIDCNGEVRHCWSTLDDWQRSDFEAIDEGWELVAGVRNSAKYRRAYLERGRGHSKTSDIALMVTYALYTSDKMIQGYTAAGDLEQARLIRTAIQKLVKLNPWLGDISIQDYKVVNRRTGSTLEIISSDAATSYGFLPDFIVIDELTHWKKPDLWDSLISSAAKRGTCMVVVIANAGFGMGTSWQWQVRENAREDPRWYFSRLDGPVASWIKPEDLEEQRRQLQVGNQFRRLWLNEWVRESGVGIEWVDVEAALIRKGPAQYDDRYIYLAGLDLGLTNDHAALVVLGIDVAAQRFHVAAVRWWAPQDHNGQVPLSEVRQALLDAFEHYKFWALIYDAHQAELMKEDFERDAAKIAATRAGYIQPQIMRASFAAKNASLMASHLVSVFRNRQIEIYPEKMLLDDLMRVTIEEKMGCFRITSRRDDRGHADRAIALAMILPYAVDGAKALLNGGQQETIAGTLA